MRRLYCNDSMFHSLGAFYSVISSTQGGWTWLSSEGRYMGAAAWGDMRPRDQSLLCAIEARFWISARAAKSGQSRLRQLVLRPVRTVPTSRREPTSRRIAKARPIVESRRGAPRRGHRAPARHEGPSRQGRRDATGVRGRHDPCGRSSPARHRRAPAGADRRRGAERASATCGCWNISTRRGSRRRRAAKPRLHLWVPPTPGRSRRHDRRGPGCSRILRGAARRADQRTRSIAASRRRLRTCNGARRRRHRFARIGEIRRPTAATRMADLMAFMVARNGIIALYQGAAETGPRALGHRSIFANPCDPRRARTAQRTGEIPRGDPPIGADGDAGSCAGVL